VGFGEIAQYHARHLVACGASVVGAVTKRSTPPEVERYASLACMFPHVDAITVAVPNHLHAEVCLRAIEAGKAALVEKPLCLTRAELAAIERALPALRAPVQVGLRLRWNPALRAIKAQIPVRREVRCTYRLGIERLALGKRWTRRISESGGAFFSLGVHALDLARWIGDARGRALNGLEGSTAVCDASAEFPLIASISGVLPDGVRIVAVADLRGSASFHLEVAIDGNVLDFSESCWPRPAPDEEGAADAEYAGLIADFVHACRVGDLRTLELAEIVQLHRELIAAAGG
jgi:predicted dehydrogenase